MIKITRLSFVIFEQSQLTTVSVKELDCLVWIKQPMTETKPRVQMKEINIRQCKKKKILFWNCHTN